MTHSIHANHATATETDASTRPSTPWPSVHPRERPRATTGTCDKIKFNMKEYESHK